MDAFFVFYGTQDMPKSTKKHGFSLLVLDISKNQRTHSNKDELFLKLIGKKSKTL